MGEFSVPVKRLGPEVRKGSDYCRKGHKLLLGNVKINRYGWRQCMTCYEANRKMAKVVKTKEGKAETVCPACGRARLVVLTTAKRLAKKPMPCRSCSRKIVRGKLVFKLQNCKQCGKEFAGRSGATRYCDKCAARDPRVSKPCPVCGNNFVGYESKKTCSPACRRRFRLNASYFGGRLFESEGWATKTCQICSRVVPKRFHIHHVFGHPNHTRLVLLCAGCHDMVSKLAMRKAFGQKEYQLLHYYAMAQKLGREPSEEEMLKKYN